MNEKMNHKCNGPFLTLLVVSLILMAAGPVDAQNTDRSLPEQISTPFIDRIQDMPVQDGLESELWGNEFVRPREVENGVESPDWAYWGGDVIKGPEGRYHMFVARWPRSAGHGGWGGQSRIARCTSDDPTGPFTDCEDIFGDSYGHNPAVIEKDGTYAVFNYKGDYDIAVSDSLSGPWEKVNVDQEGISHWTNPAPVVREDGSILVVNRTPHHVYVADDLRGPYEIAQKHWTPRGFVNVEDQTVWKENGWYHMVANQWSRRTGFYMYSKDGIDWQLPDNYMAYIPGVTRYENGTSTLWFKLERPMILKQDGRATHLYLAVVDVPKDRDRGGDMHNSKTVALPLQPTGTDRHPDRTVSDGAYRIQNVKHGASLSVNGKKGANGAPAVLSPWANRRNQRWLVTHLEDGAYRLEVGYNVVKVQKVLSVNRAKNGGTADLIQTSWNDRASNRQLWNIRPNDDQTYRLEHVPTGRVAGVRNTSGEMPRVVLTDWTGASGQKWKLEIPVQNPDPLNINKPARTSNVFQGKRVAHGPSRAVDGRLSTRWATDTDITSPWIEIDLGEPTEIGRIKIAEAYAGRIQSHSLEYRSNGEWKTIYRGADVGSNFVQTFEPVKARRIRLNIHNATKGPTIKEIWLYGPTE